MSKDDSSSDIQTSTEVLVTDPDPVQIGKSHDELETDTDAGTETETTAASESEPIVDPKPGLSPGGLSRFGIFNFVLIIALAATAGYYWWQQQQQALEYQRNLAELGQQLSHKASNESLVAGLTPLQSEVRDLGAKLGQLETGQKGLRESGEKLYQLFGRDKNAWQLAEVEYLMRVAQHKLLLQDDFEGAAITLQAASDKIALTADPGLLSVRVLISEEIAVLKTRKRADLVGMTLILAQLSRQIRVLRPGFAIRIDDSRPTPSISPDASWIERFNVFIGSLVQVRHETSEPTEVEAEVADIGETLADNLKLARWSVLERDAWQYQQLIEQSLRLFRQFYDLDNAANHDFLAQLQGLQKMPLKPEKPDINASLRELQRVLALRENAPTPDPASADEVSSTPAAEVSPVADPATTTAPAAEPAQ